MMRIFQFSISFLAISGLATAQRGDREGHDMKPPPAEWKIPPAPVLTAEKELATFAVEDGFRVELVAAEPMTHDPVALAFDGNGRMWVAEMRGYMPNIDGHGEDVKNGRIVVIEDTDGDGKADKHTVFLDKLVMPRAVSLAGADKILLWANGSTLFETEIKIADDGTISAGETTEVDDNYARGSNPEHKQNGLMFALDNWRYNSKSGHRYRKVDGKWVKDETETRGQWGISQDNYGRLFTNTNSNLVTADAVAPGLTMRNRNQDFSARKSTGIKDQSTFPSRINPGVNRGYLPGTLTKDGYLAKPTAASGLVVYRGDQFPAEYANNLFVNEPAGNLVKRLILKESPDGGYDISQAYKGKEFFTSTDERSRIVNSFTAPDGTLYFLDFYRGIIQHAAYVTTYLRRQYEERALDTPVGLGRIWRIAHEGKPLGKQPKMQEESSVELVAHLSHPNGWWRDTAQRLIVERGDESAVEALRDVVRSSDNALARIHAAWTLEGLGKLLAEDVAEGVKAKDPWAVAEVIRAADALAGDEKVLAAIKPAISNSAAQVQRQLAASLGLHGEAGVKLLAETIADSKDKLLAELAISSVGGHEVELLEALPDNHVARGNLIATAVKASGDNIKAIATHATSESDFKILGSAAIKSRNAKGILEVLAMDTTEKNQKALYSGMISAGKDKKFKPITVAALPEKAPDSLGKLFTTKEEKVVSFLKTEEHKKQFEEGKVQYQRICVACHQPDGKGQQFLAPPIAGSEWINGPDNQLIAIVMDGAIGPIHVDGKLYEAPEIQPLMPGLRTNPEFTDEQLAAIMTYVRNEWGNAAKPISAKAVKEYREKNEMREPFTEAELRKIK